MPRFYVSFPSMNRYKHNSGIWGLGMLLFLASCAMNTTPQTGSANKVNPWQPESRTYEEFIKSVQFYPGPANQGPGLKALSPVIYLNDPSSFLTLEFDELVPRDTPVSLLYADITNCDANWNPTNVLPIEFYEGFTRDPVDIYQRSDFTKVEYIHYLYSFPQENEYFKKSGNYILTVYRNNSKDSPVLTQRFVVVEPRVGLAITNLLQTRIERSQLSRVNFQIDIEGLNIIDPARDLNIRVIQNFRWDNDLRISRPTFFGNNSLEYSMNVMPDFPSGTEFYQLNSRSYRLYGQSVENIRETPQITYVSLFPDKVRNRNEFGPIRDRNGVFTVEVDEWPDPTLNADYNWVDFTLLSEPREEEVYLWGKLTDWRLSPANKMAYSDAKRAYVGKLLLKQGIYDYQYVLKKADGSIDELSLNGKFGDRENFYDILIYYRSPTDRTDQLLGFYPLNYYR